MKRPLIWLAPQSIGVSGHPPIGQDTTIYGWCPSPPASLGSHANWCDVCHCHWGGGSSTGTIGGTGGAAGFGQRWDVIAPCQPPWAISMWEDQSSIGGISMIWTGGFLYPHLDSSGNATGSNSGTFTYSFGGVDILTLSAQTFSVPDTSMVPPVWSLTMLTFTRSRIYTVWSGAPATLIPDMLT